MKPPKYDTVHEAIRDYILVALDSSHALDSERDLAEQFGVSRTTVRQALSRLEAEGLVVRIHGSGTYKVDSLLIGKTLRLTSFSEDMVERGLIPSSQVLESVTIDANDVVASAIGVSVGDKVLSLRRLRLASGQPMAIEHVYLPLERFPDVDAADLSGSLYELLLTRYDRRVEAARQRIRARMLRPDESELLETTDETAAIVVERTSSDRYGIPVELATTVYRADRYEFDLTIRAKP